MWWPERRTTVSRVAGLALALALAGLLGGCFEPLYGEKTFSGKPGLRQHLSAVTVEQIPASTASPEARIAVAIRNALIFNLTGGAGHTAHHPPAHHHHIDAESAGDRRHHHGAAGRAAVRHQRVLYAG